MGNPGPGGWACIILSNSKDKNIIAGAEKSTTNNRMELTAIINSLNELDKNQTIQLFTDSKYVIEGITMWINKWVKNNWKTASRKEVKNKDLWEKLYKLNNSHFIKWEWVKGHSGNLFNEEVDEIAREQAEKLNRI